jgi:1-acyl-sn-glycerol-3-phosphate acyltransferase
LPGRVPSAHARTDPEDPVPTLYSAASRVFELGFRTLGVVQHVEGLEHIPASGPAIIASNHIGYLDFAFVMLGPPRPRREVRFLARGDLFERPLTGAALRALRQIPVDEHGDPKAAMDAAKRSLEAGEIVGLHPEATVNPTFLPLRAKSGAVRLSQATGAPIVPCAVWGSQRLLTKWRAPRWPGRGIPVRVRYGEPFTPDAGPASSSSRELMRRIAEMVDALIAIEAAPPGAWWVPADRGGSAPRFEDIRARLDAQVVERRGRAAGRRQGPAGTMPPDEPRAREDG